MFAGVIVVIGCVAVAALGIIHFKMDDLPPKAKLLCEVWRLVEEEKKPLLRSGRLHNYADENTRGGKRSLQKMH